tara:strand:+ start:54 stop:560 length:507 start_codon:yes stop_codon:yes gene_type:complete
MSYKIIKNFLDIDFFNQVGNLILGTDFPWRRQGYRFNEDGTDSLYFNHIFFNNMCENSPAYLKIILPILHKLDCIAPIQIRANMFISKLFTKSGWHSDYEEKCKTAILYLNTCDGGTELKINNKIKFIKAEKNKMLIFDSSVSHRALTSKEEPIRYIINFNYYTKGKE